MADEIHEIETRLAALRARRQRWQNRYAAVENVHGKATERAQAKATLRLVDEQIVAAEKKLTTAHHRAARAENTAIAIVEDENMPTSSNADFSYFPPSPGMTLRANATLNMSEVAKELGLPNWMIRRGTYITGRAAEIFMSSRNAEKMLETRMVRYVRSPPPSQGGSHA